MSKTLRVLLVGVALIGAAAPAFARGGGGGGGDPGGAQSAWDPSIAGISITVPGRETPSAPPRRTAEAREDICGLYRGQTICRPR